MDDVTIDVALRGDKFVNDAIDLQHEFRFYSYSFLFSLRWCMSPLSLFTSYICSTNSDFFSAFSYLKFIFDFCLGRYNNFAEIVT